MWAQRVVRVLEKCVCVAGGCPYIMQIRSRIVIRATEQVPLLWINLMIGSSCNQILIASHTGWERERWSPLPSSWSRNTCAGEHVCTSAVPASRSQGRGDFELCAHRSVLEHTHTHILLMSQRGTGILHSQALQEHLKHTWLPSQLLLVSDITSLTHTDPLNQALKSA